MSLIEQEASVDLVKIVNMIHNVNHVAQQHSSA